MVRGKRILIVDDEPEHCLVVAQALKRGGYETEVAGDGAQALDRLNENTYDLHVLDIRMEPVDGIELLKTIRERNPKSQVIMLSAFGEVDVAVRCMKLGAYDFIAKPVILDELMITVANALRSREMENELETLRKQLALQQTPHQLLGESPAMQDLLRTIEKIARHNLTVMIRGESGTGKELTARALHTLSQRTHAPFVSVDCATLPETLVESELFGYERGAFTGATGRKIGRFEQAGDGTLFLDEIGNLQPSIQIKLLRVLQERRFTRLGGKEELSFGATIVSATHVDLEQAIRDGSFREDLYYRLNEFQLRLPPLRSRREDIPLLVRHYIDRFNRQFKKQVRDLSPEVMSFFMQYHWPGNVREVVNVVKRGVVLAQDWIQVDHLPEGTFRDTTIPSTAEPESLEGTSLKEIVKRQTTRIEREIILKTLEETRWNRSLTAKKLEIDYKTLYNKMKEYELG